MLYTPLMKKRLTRHAAAMIEQSLVHFPELNGRIITVGYTRVHLGSAAMSRKSHGEPRLVIRLRVRDLTYQTIGHELTHLVQGLFLDGQGPAAYERIPSGETQCDIWTLARHKLFCDDTPTYIKMPRKMRELWPVYASSVRQLCVAAIGKRRNFRTYIRWLESEIAMLARPTRQNHNAPAQLSFSFPS